MDRKKQTIYQKYIKRLLDIVISLFAIIVLSPVLLIVAILVRIKLGAPVLFNQERVGFNQNIFMMHKFRTMLPAQTLNGKIISDEERLEYVQRGIELLSDEKRLTKFGKLLRSLSIDELPELLNIIKGDMSIVGPRPLVKIYIPYYTDEENHRHDVRPGLTGLAQVHGRNSVTWEERFKYDINYVNDVTFINDLKIIAKTILVVFKRSDIGQGNSKPKAFNIEREEELERRNNIKLKGN